MFTGIIEVIGRIEKAQPDRDNRVFEVSCPFRAKAGESIAVDGVCLTVKQALPNGFLADAVAETIALTTLKLRRQGDSVNLERALLPTNRMGGHIVSGHVDETGKVLNIRTLPGSHRFEFGVSPEGSRLVVNKGSIAIDGISLTVAEVKGQRVVVSIIPYTVQNTTLKLRRIGDDVNIEFDVISKYVARMMPSHRGEQ
jgi:riboflavin synthase